MDGVASGNSELRLVKKKVVCRRSLKLHPPGNLQLQPNTSHAQCNLHICEVFFLVCWSYSERTIDRTVVFDLEVSRFHAKLFSLADPPAIVCRGHLVIETHERSCGPGL